MPTSSFTFLCWELESKCPQLGEVTAVILWTNLATVQQKCLRPVTKKMREQIGLELGSRICDNCRKALYKPMPPTKEEPSEEPYTVPSPPSPEFPSSPSSPDVHWLSAIWGPRESEWLLGESRQNTIWITKSISFKSVH